MTNRDGKDNGRKCVHVGVRETLSVLSLLSLIDRRILFDMYQPWYLSRNHIAHLNKQISQESQFCHHLLIFMLQTIFCVTQEKNVGTMENVFMGKKPWNYFSKFLLLYLTEAHVTRAEMSQGHVNDDRIYIYGSIKMREDKPKMEKIIATISRQRAWHLYDII